MYKISVFIPSDHLEPVKAAMFAAGAGKVGDYDCCAWQTEGEGQFRPLAGSSPFIGQQGKVETVCEYKVEMVCDNVHLREAIYAMRLAHPYEEPAFDIIELIKVPI
ncbi:CBU_2076 family Dot/Icm type IV secretion system effector [Aurantivibrio plasticivorans]